MKFFLPAASTAEQAEQILAGIKKWLGGDGVTEFSDRRIWSLSWHHNSKACYAEVGKITDFNGETVVAIIYDPSRCLYHVCTPNRGVRGGDAILAGEDWQTSVQDFEE